MDRAVIALVLAGIGLFFWRLGDRDLWSSHEARAAMNARSLLAPDSAGLPRLEEGQLELQKPPGFYWLVALVAWARGGSVDGVAVRLPAALAALGVVLLVWYSLARGMGRPRAGLLAALVLISNIHFPWLARIGRIDMPLCLCVTLAGFAFLLALEPSTRQRRFCLAMGYLACAAGVLLKGPIGLVLPGVIVAAWLLLDGRWPAFWEGRAWYELLRELALVPGGLLVLAVCLPVYLWLEIASEGAFSREFLWYHNFTRGLGGSRLREHPPWQHLGYLFLYLLPFSPLLLAALWKQAREDRQAWLGLAWLVGVVVVLSAVRFKRADYLLPAYPGAAVFLGCWLDRVLRPGMYGVIAGIAAVVLVGWLVRLEVGLPAEESYRDYRAFAREIRVREADTVVFFRAEAHALSFHVGRPLVHLVHYAELHQQVRAAACHAILPPTELDEVASIPGLVVEEVLRNTTLAGGKHERPLVLVRLTCTSNRPANHASDSRTAAHLAPAPECDPAGP